MIGFSRRKNMAAISDYLEKQLLSLFSEDRVPSLVIPIYLIILLLVMLIYLMVNLVIYQ